MSTFDIPAPMASTIADIVRASGTKTLETGGFILAPVGTEHSVVLAAAGDQGIDRSWGLFQVSGIAVARLFDWADEHEFRVLAQWHSHRFEAFLSRTDLAYGFNVPGFRTTVIPDYARPPADPAAWGWWRYEDSIWADTPAPILSDANFRVVTFDEGGVYDH